MSHPAEGAIKAKLRKKASYLRASAPMPQPRFQAARGGNNIGKRRTTLILQNIDLRTF